MLCLVPACAPNKPPDANTEKRKVVFLTDSTHWTDSYTSDLRVMLEEEGARTLVSGEADETLGNLLSRLPWLLQPGVDVFYLDRNFAGQHAKDSLEANLSQLGYMVEIVEYSTIPEQPE